MGVYVGGRGMGVGVYCGCVGVGVYWRCVWAWADERGRGCKSHKDMEGGVCYRPETVRYIKH